MNRRATVAIAATLGLVGIVLLIGQGLHPALASRFGVDSYAVPTGDRSTLPPVPAPATTPGSNSTANSARTTPATSAPGLAAEAAPAPSPQIAVPPQDVDPHKAFGSKSAPIIMEIFSDYQCPACKTFFLTTNRQLMDNYVNTGKVYVIHRDYPLAMHAHSRVAARYARAAAELGKVEPVEQALFENQEKWEQTGDVDGTVAGVLSAGEMNKVRALVKGGTLDALIDKDFAQGQIYRVNQTPTTVFHAKGQTYPFAGVMTNDTLKQFLEQLLTQK